jgi:hypothetical protein
MQVVFKVASKGSLRFSEDFYTKLPKILSEIGNKTTTGMGAKITSTLEELFVFAVAFNKLDDIPVFYSALEQRLVLMAEHETDADLFDELLARHPELANHPRMSSVVGAWDNLMLKTKEVASDKSAPIQVEIERRERAGEELGVEVFEGKDEELPDGTMSKADMREAALRGELPGQHSIKAPPGEAVIPEQYHELMRGRGKSGGGSLPTGDVGNVMSSKSKR